MSTCPASNCKVIHEQLLRHNICAESAIDQIREKKSFDSLRDYKGGVLFVGVNYDEKDKTHTCRIEKFVK